MHDEEAVSRPETPGSSLTNSLYHATTTIDDLTMALANFSRVPSPEPPNMLTCCCGREECENVLAWLECKSRLESRLTLSAEVGQALLERHEAYVRRHEVRQPERHSDKQEINPDYPPPSPEATNFDLIELVREKTLLEKRLNQALVNNEVTEVSNKTILHELQEARTAISRLTAQHARSVGWETRLSTAILEKDDMQQERDSESNRAKVAESRLVAMKDKAAKLQTEVRRLQDIIEERRVDRLASSEAILQDARSRLESLYKSQIGKSAVTEQEELASVLESLVHDNETLKRDNAELQNLLTESREEIHVLQKEVEEQRVTPPSRASTGTPSSRPHIFTHSIPSSIFKEHTLHNLNPRSASIERKHRAPFEPLTPETGRRPLSPTDSLAPSETKWTSFSHSRPGYASSHISFEVDESVYNDEGPSSPEKPKTHKTLFLLTRSRAVQTDNWPGLLSPSPLPPYLSSSSPPDPRSESSSFSESPPSNLSALLERLVALNSRMTQADALTLTDRLKRQHLKGADVGHLSRSTVNNILSETASLRTQFRYLLEDEAVATPCTRKDFRVLFKLFKDIFTEMGQMRITLNDVILDPTVAPRVSELALHPSKAEVEKRVKERDVASSSAAGSWMAPISKLFSANGWNEAESGERLGASASSGRGPGRPIPRFTPKLGPALAASATTVNVEFSGTGVGRSTTSTVASLATQDVGESSEALSTSLSVSSGVMSIFAGAPRSTTPDPWIVVPQGPRRVQSLMKSPEATIRGTRENPNRLSRNVDAIIDVKEPLQDGEEQDSLGPLLERTLRRRGLSDSSIHSAFTSQASDPRDSAIKTPTENEGSSRPDRSSVFQTLSRTVQNFRMVASGVESPTANLSPQKPSVSGRSQPTRPSARASSASLHGLLPNLSWAAAGAILDPMTGTEPLLVGSLRDESFMRPTRRPGESHGHEYF